MTFLNIDPNVTRYPPDEIQILNLMVKPYQDGNRILVSLELIPFLESPMIELSILNSEGVISGSATIVEPPFWKHEVTMHIRSKKPTDFDYILEVVLIYPDLEDYAQKRVNFSLPPIDNISENDKMP
ncbi:hypothetical protein ACFLXB_08515 [Chloroflexota bacterium]